MPSPHLPPRRGRKNSRFDEEDEYFASSFFLFVDVRDSTIVPDSGSRVLVWRFPLSKSVES